MQNMFRRQSVSQCARGLRLRVCGIYSLVVFPLYIVYACVCVLYGVYRLYNLFERVHLRRKCMGVCADWSH